MNIQEIPLTPNNQRFAISLGGQSFNMRIQWRDAAGWLLDLMDNSGVALINGIPLVPGTDLLAQYGYLNIGGALVVGVDVVAEQYPTKNNLGISSHLYFIQEQA